MSRMKSELLDWFPVDAAKTASDQDLLGLDTEAFGAFWFLRLFCWKDGSVPSDAHRLALICRCTVDRIGPILESLSHLLEPHPAEPDRLIMPCVEEDRGLQREKHDRKRAAGAKGGRTSQNRQSSQTTNARSQEGKGRPMASAGEATASCDSDPESIASHAGSSAQAMVSSAQALVSGAQADASTARAIRLDKSREEKIRRPTPPTPPPGTSAGAEPVAVAGGSPMPGGGPPGAVRSSSASKRSPPGEIEAVFDAHDLGLRTLAEETGRAFRAHSRSQSKRRKAVADAVRTVGPRVARLAARNLPLSAHHRGENDRGSRYLDIDYAMRRPESYAEIYDGPDEGFAAELRKSLHPPEPELTGYVSPGGVTRGKVDWE